MVTKVWLKIQAILDIIKSDKFYLITFDEKSEVDYRTSYGISEDDVYEKNFK